MKKALLVATVMLLIAAPVQAKRGGGATGPNPVGVYDANGGFVGTLISITSYHPQDTRVTIWLPDLGMFTMLEKQTGRLVSDVSIPEMSYLELNCAGTAYSRVGNSAMGDFVFGFDSEFYSFVPGPYLWDAMVLSQKFPGGSCQNIAPDPRALWELTPVTFTAPTGPLTFK